MAYALLFPGQGSQFAGMGLDVRDAFPSAAEVFKRADDALAYPLSRVIFEGPEEELKKTEVTQPAILTTSIAVLAALRDSAGRELNPAFLAGHSLGEYTALVAGGSLSLEDCVRLVATRGRLMQEAVPEGKGAMAAILGLDSSAVEEICAEATPGGECQPANFNSPGQVVVSGETGAVQRVMDLAKTRGAKKVVPLNVSAPFHSSLMRPVADRLMEAFGECTWKEPSAPVVSNAFARPLSTVKEIQGALFDQTFMPVLWDRSVNWMADAGVCAFLEIGPGTVLAGLVKKCRKGLLVQSCGAVGDIEKTVSILKGDDAA